MSIRTRQSPPQARLGLRLASAAFAVCVGTLTFVPAAPAAGATTVTGKLDGGRGYTVVGVTRPGTGPSVRVRPNGSFKLRFSGRGAEGATVHVVKPSGAYGGPVVFSSTRLRGYMTLSGRSAQLGRIRLGRGYATLRREPSAGVYDRKRSVQMRGGKPLGAGRLGLLKISRRSALIAQASSALGADSDQDGLTNNFDVDDDGDATLDAADKDSAEGGVPFLPHFSSYLRLEFPRAANASAGGGESVDSLLSGDSFVLAFRLGGGATRSVQAVDVNCFELAYCRSGTGTATVVNETRDGRTPSEPAHGSRWVGYDPNNDGLPNLPVQESQFRLFSIETHPRTTRAQLNPGDTFDYRLSGSGVPPSLMATLDYVFVSTPAIQSYDAGSGPVTVSYPAAGDAPGTGENPIQLTDSKLRLSAWRPQREPIPGAESGGLIDLGHLGWGAKLATGDGAVMACQAGDFSGLSPTLRPASGPEGTGPAPQLEDTADDAPADPAATVSFTLDLGACLSRRGIGVSGQKIAVDVGANDRRGAESTQALHVCLPGGTGNCR